MSQSRLLFGLAVRHLQPFLAPDARHTFLVHRPASITQQYRDPPAALATILPGPRADVRGQCRLVICCNSRLALCGARLTQNPARQPFRHTEHRHNLPHTIPAPGRAQKFPEAASLRISFSSVRSDTALRPAEYVRRKALSPEGQKLCFYRCCYDHLASKVDVAVTNRRQQWAFIIKAADK